MSVILARRGLMVVIPVTSHATVFVTVESLVS
jgi:hypothetical protein